MKIKGEREAPKSVNKSNEYETEKDGFKLKVLATKTKNSLISAGVSGMIFF